MIEHHVSLSQFADLLGLDEKSIRFVAFQPSDSSVAIFVEDDMAQTSGTCPPLSDNTKRKPKGKRK
jgi:hypothetical protein